MNEKSFFITAVIIGLFLAGLSFRNGSLLLLSMPFLVFLMLGILKYPGKMDLRVVRTINRTSSIPHESIEMSVLVENTGDTQMYLFSTDTHFPSIRLLDGKWKRRFLLSPGEQIHLKNTFIADRGLYLWKSINIAATDTFSLFEIHKDFPALSEILVRPDPVRLRHIPIRPRFTRHIPGSIPARLPGSGTNFYGVREYRAGDPLRRIHWRMIARHPRQLFTKEFEQDEVADIGIILDSRNINGDLPEGNSFFDYAVRATASLAEVFLREGNRVGLLIFGEKMSALFPGGGKRQLHRIYINLARATVTKCIPLEYMHYFSSRLFPSKSLIFLISPVVNQDLPAYKRLRSAGYQVILLSPNPVEYAAQNKPASQITSLAYRASKIERAVHLNQLLSMGIKVVDWPVDRSLNNVICEGLSASDISHRRYGGI